MDKFITESDNEGFERVPDRDGSFVSDRKNRVYPALTFWVVTHVDHMSAADFETKLRQIILKADLDIDYCTPVKSRKRPVPWMHTLQHCARLSRTISGDTSET